MAPIAKQERDAATTITQDTAVQPVAQIASGERASVVRLQADASTSDRIMSQEVSADRQVLVDKVLERFGAKVFTELAAHHPGRSARWLAERVVDQVEVNARNAFKQLSEVTDAEMAKAISVTLSHIKKPVITPVEGPKANNAGLHDPRPYAVAEAILESVTQHAAHQTLKNYHEAVGDDTFVRVVKSALTRNGVFAWTGTELRYNGERQQRDLVHGLLRTGKIPQECQYQSNDPNDSTAIGAQYQQQRDRSDRLAAERKVAEEQKKEMKAQQELDGYLSGARSEQEKAQIMRNWKSAAESPATDKAQAKRLIDALNRARANDPKLETTSTYIDSTNNRYSAADIDAARRFAPTVAAAMMAKGPVAYEQSRPVTQDEIVELKEKLQTTRESITNGLRRSQELSKKIDALSSLSSSGELRQLVGADSKKLKDYQRSCQALESSLQKIDSLCNQLDRASVASPNYPQLLTEFKAAQRDILQIGGLNDYRAKIGSELIAVERRYRLGNEEARNLAALDNLSPEEKRKSLLTLEGTLSAQLAAGKDVSHTLKAIEQLDSDPKRIASYLYRLERDGKHELVERFAKSIQSHGSLKNSLDSVLKESLNNLDEPQKQRVNQIQNALAGVDATVKQHAPVAAQDADSPTLAA